MEAGLTRSMTIPTVKGSLSAVLVRVDLVFDFSVMVSVSANGDCTIACAE
jgi:hypothetical protein